MIRVTLYCVRAVVPMGCFPFKLCKRRKKIGEMIRLNDTTYRWLIGFLKIVICIKPVQLYWPVERSVIIFSAAQILEGRNSNLW